MGPPYKGKGKNAAVGNGCKGGWVYVPDHLPRSAYAAYAALKGGVAQQPNWPQRSTGAPKGAGGCQVMSFDLEGIREFLRSSGGMVSLGKLTTFFPGTKMASLQPHFRIEQSDNGDFNVSIGGGDGSNPIQRARKKKGKEQSGAGVSPPEPLADEQVAEVAAYVQANGGAVDLGKLSTFFPGLKKRQLEPHFGISGGDQCTVTVRDKSVKRKIDIDDVMLQEITLYLQECGGVASLGKLSTLFEGVKMAQLTDHFDVFETARDHSVSLRGSGNCSPAHNGAPAQKVRKTSQREQVCHQFLRGACHYGENCKYAHQMAADTTQAPSKKKQRKDPNAPPPPDLEQSVVQHIRAFLQDCGGAVPLGKVTTQFEGVKKAQLATHFAICGSGDPSSGDFTVCLDVPTAEEAGLRPLPFEPLV